jgi:hypothetical protein
MSFWKNRPKCSPTHFFLKISAQVHRWKSFWLLQ